MENQGGRVGQKGRVIRNPAQAGTDYTTEHSALSSYMKLDSIITTASFLDESLQAATATEIPAGEKSVRRGDFVPFHYLLWETVCD